MPKYQPLNLIGGFYTDDSLSWSAQDTVNWLPLMAEVDGTRTVAKLRSPPGLQLFATLSDGPVRGAHNVEGRYFTVSGGSLFQVSTSGIPTNRGSIPGVERVSMAHNQISFGNQLTIVNGDSGYVWNTVANTLTKITDEGFDGSIQTDFLDGYMLHVDPFGRFWFHSELADALSFSTLDRYQSEASPDKIVGLKAFQSEVVVFNDTTIEFFVNVGGGEGQTFENKQIVINKGCASRHSIQRINNTLVWLGDDGAVYALNGYREQRISTVPLEQAIADNDWTQAFSTVWESEGHNVYYLTFPDGRTWGYDFMSGLWTRRESYEMDRWRINTLTFFDTKWIAGDFQTGLLYELKWGIYTENGRNLISERATGYSHSDQNRVQCPYLELIFDTGWGPNPADLDPLVITGDAPDVMINSPYSYAYSASGGFGVYTFTTPGPLPGGLTLSADGVISGTASVGGAFPFTVTVTDSNGNTSSVNDSITVSVTSDLAVAFSNELDLYSGVTLAFAKFQDITTGLAPTGVSVTSDHQFIFEYGPAAPFFNVYERQSNGTYAHITTPFTGVVPAATIHAACISPDGNYIFLSQTNNFRFYKKTSGSQWAHIGTFVAPDRCLENAAAWSPDSQTLAACLNNNPGLYFFPVNGGAVVPTQVPLFTLSGTCTGVCWFRDSLRIAVVGPAGLNIARFNGVTAIRLDGVTVTPGSNPQVVVSPDNATLFYTNQTGTALRAANWNGTTVTALTAPTQPTGVPPVGGCISMTRDGDVLCVGSSSPNVTVFSVAGATLTTLVTTIVTSNNSKVEFFDNVEN